MPVIVKREAGDSQYEEINATNPFPVAFEMPRLGPAGTGEIAGSATAVAMPSLACYRVRYKAQPENVGDVFIALTPQATVAAGTTDVTTGWQLLPGEETPWLYVGNMNQHYRISDNAGDDLTFYAEKLL